MSAGATRHRNAAAPLLVPGRTCWRIERAERAAWLVDARDYFEALAAALARARERVFLIGWDFHSRVSLVTELAEGERAIFPRGEEGDLPTQLGRLLDALARRCPALHVHVLEWDFSMLYALERQVLPLLQLGARTHRRVHFRLDDAHPFGGSQHQKLVVVDDALAFAGGIDVTTHRWDTRAHRAEEPRRRNPGGSPYPPFHDVALAVDGAAAAALGELARERWRRATGQRLPTVKAPADPWPEALAPDLRGVDVGIARTDPAYAGRPEVREVEALYAACIDGARESLYLENQYLTCDALAARIARRLGERDGPDVVIVGPRCCAGWLEERAMGALRARLVSRLREADRYGRLRVLHPHVEGMDDDFLNVHAKVLVVDDRLARVGSANFSNRSMGLDSECDLAIEAADGDDETARAVARLRDDLLAEHLGTTAERVAEARREHGSLVRAVDALRGDGRTLRELEEDPDAWPAELLGGVADPERPVELEELAGLLATPKDGTEPGGPRRRHRRNLLLATLGVVVLGLAWRLAPLSEWADPEHLQTLVAPLRGSAWGAVAASLAFALASLAFIPVLALIVAAALVFEPLTALAVAWIGSILGAGIGYELGRRLWRDTVRRAAGPRLAALSRRLERRGLLATALVRTLPIAPFAAVNLVAGASRVSLRDFALGTALGMAPGIALITLVTDRVGRALSDPSAWSWAWAAAAAAVATGLLLLAWRGARESAPPGAEEASERAGPAAKARDFLA